MRPARVFEHGDCDASVPRYLENKMSYPIRTDRMALVVLLFLFFGYFAIRADSQDFTKSNTQKAYFQNKYRGMIDKIEGQGYLQIKGHIKVNISKMADSDKQSRAISIAEAFLKEEAAILEISDLNDFKRSSSLDGKGNLYISYKQLLGDLEIEPCGMPYITLIVGSDESIISLYADVVPVSAEMRKASLMNTITKEESMVVVERELNSHATTTTFQITSSEKYFSSRSPYIIWHVSVRGGQKPWVYILNAISGEIIRKRQNSWYGCE